MTQARLVVCVNERLGPGQKSCGGSGSRQLIEKIKTYCQLQGVNIDITEQVCLGRCEQGITMRIAPGGPFFQQVTQNQIPEIVSQLIGYVHKSSGRVKQN